MSGPKKVKPLVERLKGVQAKFGDKPSDYSGPTLQELANGPILDAARAPLPAGRLTAEELRQREARNAKAGAFPPKT